MVATTFVHKDRTIFGSVVISIVLHLVILTPGLRNLVPDDLFSLEEREIELPPLEFELVSPPERPTPTDRLSRYLSTVSSAASDDSPENDESALPKREGVVPIPDTPSRQEGAEGGGESELPPLPEEVTDLGEAFERSKFLTQKSPSRAPSFPEQNPDFKSESSARASVGGISINTTAWDFAPYLLDLKHRIKQHWIPPLAFTALGAIHGYTRINFRIYPDGSMQALAVVESHGHESLHRSSMNAIKGAAPFRPLPDEFPEEYLDITFGFYYLLPGDEKEFFGKE
ncbi:MAG: energy transducer TonB [Candidatus Latescibacterota bacterium]|nr:MAG: energy transducer TonB [Candidatus Latescibacterota bacterium]